MKVSPAVSFDVMTGKLTETYFYEHRLGRFSKPCYFLWLSFHRKLEGRTPSPSPHMGLGLQWVLIKAGYHHCQEKLLGSTTSLLKAPGQRDDTTKANFLMHSFT